MTDLLFETRIAMIEALEKTQDDTRLQELVQGDSRLRAYGSVLGRACSYLQDPVMVEKLLTLPGLDQSSEDYENTIIDVFMNYASDERKKNSAITDLLKPRLGNDENKLTHFLSSLFYRAADNARGPVNTELAKVLIDAGADPERAHQLQSIQLESQRTAINTQLRRMRAFKATLG